LNLINSPGPKMKFFVKNGLFHSKFHFWTRAINRIYKNQKNNDFNSIAVPGPCIRGYSSNNSMSSPEHSRKSCRYLFSAFSYKKPSRNAILIYSIKFRLLMLKPPKTVRVLVRYGSHLYEKLAFKRQNGTFKSR
jgi:hypothetical protein